MSTYTEPTHTANQLSMHPDPVTDPVLDEVRMRLRESTFGAIRRLHCEFRDGVLVLRGEVPTFYMRQIALALVQKIGGVEELDDCIIVDSISPRQTRMRH